MLSVNFKPVLSAPNLVNKIVLTDNAYSDTSVVYMDKKDAPFQDTLAWVTIKDPASSGNMLERWMYVQHVLFQDYVDVIQRDDEGNPVLDSNGFPIKNSLRNVTGMVQVILREHKNILTRSAFIDHFNIPSLLSFALKEYDLIEKYNAYNEVDWEGIHDLISHRGIKLYTYLENRPPIIPVNLFWAGLYLADGLDDLLFHFSSRVIERAVVIPTPATLKTLNHQAPPQLTELVWKKRRFVDLDPSIVYDTIAWPEETNESRYVELNENKVLFTTTSNTDFERFSGISGSPIGAVLRCNKVIQGSDRTLIRKWLNETYINRYLFYAFSTRRLPASFLEDKDWSKIEYIFTNDDYSIVVRHEPRPLNRLITQQTVERKETFVGRVTSFSGNSITLTDLRNESSSHRDLFLDESYTLSVPPLLTDRDTYRFGNILTVDMVGKDLYFQIANNTVTVLSASSLYSPLSDDVKIQPMHNGNPVAKIRHFIEYLSYACTDSKIAFESDPIYDYKYDSHEINPESGSDFRINEWEINDLSPNAFSHVLVDQLATAKVTFKLKANRTEILEFLNRDNDPAGTFPLGPEYIEALADYWLINFQYVSILANFSLSAARLRWSASAFQGYMGTSALGTTFYDNIAPDIDSSLFTGYRGRSLGESKPFPLVFPDPGIRLTGPANYIQVNGTPGWRYDLIAQEISRRYIANHLETFTAQIQLVYA